MDDSPNANPYDTVLITMNSAADKVPGQVLKIRPWIQDFTMGDPPYGVTEVQAQIDAAIEGGREWLDALESGQLASPWARSEPVTARRSRRRRIDLELIAHRIVDEQRLRSMALLSLLPNRHLRPNVQPKPFRSTASILLQSLTNRNQ